MMVDSRKNGQRKTLAGYKRRAGFYGL